MFADLVAGEYDQGQNSQIDTNGDYSGLKNSNSNDSEKKLNEEQRELIELEKFGMMKRWTDVAFVHRMRNLRSQKVFGMDKARLEKIIERQFYLRQNRLEEAKRFYEYFQGPWEKMSQQEREIQLSVRWASRVNRGSIKRVGDGCITFIIQVAPFRLGVLGDFQDRYLASIQATEVGLFRVQVQHLDEVEGVICGYSQFTSHSHPKRIHMSQIHEGPLKFNDLVKNTDDFQLQTSIDEENQCLNIVY